MWGKWEKNFIKYRKLIYDALDLNKLFAYQKWRIACFFKIACHLNVKFNCLLDINYRIIIPVNWKCVFIY